MAQEMKPCFDADPPQRLVAPGYMLMVCPVCGFDCIQLTGAEVVGGHVDIRAYCESGHAFTVTLQPHKGAVIVGSVREADVDPNEIDAWERGLEMGASGE